MKATLSVKERFGCLRGLALLLSCECERDSWFCFVVWAHLGQNWAIARLDLVGRLSYRYRAVYVRSFSSVVCRLRTPPFPASGAKGASSVGQIIRLRGLRFRRVSSPSINNFMNNLMNYIIVECVSLSDELKVKTLRNKSVISTLPSSVSYIIIYVYYINIYQWLRFEFARKDYYTSG